jgi:hypothetical protein
VGWISAHKSFLTLGRQRGVFVSEAFTVDRGLWAIAGVPNALSEIRSHHELREYEANLLGGPFFGGVVEARDRDGWDFLELRADVSLPGVPRRFGGLSGGGLWQVSLSRSGPSGPISWTREPRL